jgi:hypothetical protein
LVPVAKSEKMHVFIEGFTWSETLNNACLARQAVNSPGAANSDSPSSGSETASPNKKPLLFGNGHAIPECHREENSKNYNLRFKKAYRINNEFL